jgi:hypothetical protein
MKLNMGKYGYDQEHKNKKEKKIRPHNLAIWLMAILKKRIANTKSKDQE